MREFKIKLLILDVNFERKKSKHRVKIPYVRVDKVKFSTKAGNLAIIYPCYNVQLIWEVVSIQQGFCGQLGGWKEIKKSPWSVFRVLCSFTLLCFWLSFVPFPAHPLCHLNRHFVLRLTSRLKWSKRSMRPLRFSVSRPFIPIRSLPASPYLYLTLCQTNKYNIKLD